MPKKDKYFLIFILLLLALGGITAFVMMFSEWTR